MIIKADTTITPSPHASSHNIPIINTSAMYPVCESKDHSSWVIEVLQKYYPLHIVPTHHKPDLPKKRSEIEKQIVMFKTTTKTITTMIESSIQESAHMGGDGLSHLWLNNPSYFETLQKHVATLRKACKYIVSHGRLKRKEKNQLRSVIDYDWSDLSNTIFKIYYHIESVATVDSEGRDIEWYISKSVEMQDHVDVLIHIEKSIRLKLDYDI